MKMGTTPVPASHAARRRPSLRGMVPQLVPLLLALVAVSCLRAPLARALYLDTGDENLWTNAGKYPNMNKGFITSSSLTFIPAERCVPTQIIIKFTADFNISSGDKIAVELAGFTSGECDNVEGESIVATLDEVAGSLVTIDPGSLKLFPDSKFLGGYREGQVRQTKDLAGESRRTQAPPLPRPS